MNNEDRQVLSDFIKEAGFPEEWAEEIRFSTVETNGIK